MLLIADRLRKMRLQRGMDQKRVAAHISISRDSISAYERSVRQPSLETLCKLAELYHTSTDYLLGLTEVEDPYPKALQETEGLTTRELQIICEAVHISMQCIAETTK